MARASESGPGRWVALTYGAVAVAALVLVAIGWQTGSPGASLGGIIGVLVAAATAPVALLLAALPGHLRRVLLSDSARRAIYRDDELGHIRRALEGAIARREHDAALTLCGDLANLFGCRQEAEAYRSRIAQARAEQYEVAVQSELDRLDAALAERDWADAHQQAARIRRLYPDSHVAGDLDQRIERARAEHKHELETSFLEAAHREDVESAMELLRQLDRYLSREEAGRLTEVAQGVIVRHRENLGAGFRMAVNERRWGDAARLGETIIDEFPNSKMSTEVRSMIDVLRSRAGQTPVAAEQAGWRPNRA